VQVKDIVARIGYLSRIQKVVEIEDDWGRGSGVARKRLLPRSP